MKGKMIIHFGDIYANYDYDDNKGKYDMIYPEISRSFVAVNLHDHNGYYAAIYNDHYGNQTDNYKIITRSDLFVKNIILCILQDENPREVEFIEYVSMKDGQRNPYEIHHKMDDYGRFIENSPFLDYHGDLESRILEARLSKAPRVPVPTITWSDGTKCEPEEEP
jgi:hypothetical protein